MHYNIFFYFFILFSEDPGFKKHWLRQHIVDNELTVYFLFF